MWRWSLTSLLAHWIIISAQPLTHKHEPTHECCPCPKDGTFFTNDRPFTMENGGLSESTAVHTRDGESSGDQITLADSTGTSAFAPGGGVDDCPCRFRDADTVGSPSILIPSAVRAVWPVVSPKENEEEPKPLLHPEVGLASSVLETLRQATDEEYEDALVRDAARSAMRGTDDVESHINSALDTAKNVVTLIINPEGNEAQDEIAEASHAHESRCIHPLSRSNIASNSLTSPSNLLSEIFQTPKNIPDMDNGASNLHEQIVDVSSNTGNNLKLKSTPSLLNLFPDDGDKSHFQTPKVTLPMIFKDNTKSAIEPGNLELLKNEDSQHLLKHILTPTKIDKNDLSNINGLPIDKKEKISSKLKLKTNIPISGLKLTTMKPLNLKNLLKLKDVELIPPTTTENREISIVKNNVPKLLPSLQGIDVFKDLKSPNLGDVIRNGLKFNIKAWNKQSHKDNYKDETNDSGALSNIQIIPNSVHKTEIIDTVPSPSENKIILTNNNEEENCVNKNRDTIIKNRPKAITTQILDSVPNKHTFIKNSAPNQNIVKDTKLEPSFNKQNIDEIEQLDAVPSASENQMMVTDHVKNINLNSCEVQVIDLKERTVNDKFNNTTDKVNNSAENSSEADDDYDEEDNEEDKDDDDDKNDDGRREIQSKPRERLEDNCMNLPIKEQDLESQTSNNIENINNVPNDQQNKHFYSSSDFESMEPSESKEAETSKTNAFSKIVNDLSRLRESISRTLDDMKKPIRQYQNKSPTTESIYHSVTSEEQSSLKCNEDIKDSEIERKPEVSESTDSNYHINSQELQNMSDNLLNLSSQKDQESSTSEIMQCEETIPGINENVNGLNESIDTKSDEFDNDKLENKDMKISSQTTHLDDTETSGDITNFNNNLEDETNSKEEDSKNIHHLCSVASEDEDKMTSEASDPVITTLTRENNPNLFWNTIQSDLTDSNLNSDDRIDNNLSTKNKLSDSSLMSNMYSEHNNEEDSMSEQDNDESSLMDTQANTPFSKSVLPSLEPLENIDLDIFQLNPIIEPPNLLPKLPRLNLNSYKAKLAIPKNLGIRPLRLESSIGDKNSLLGAKLTFGSNNNLREFEKGSNLLGTSLNNLPTLEDLHESMRENAHNLLITPLEITSRNVFDDTLRSGQTISDNIRSHTKNAMKDIKQTFETALKDVKNSDLGILGDSLSNPHDFLQAVSRTHEDVNDKLKAIHYDLNDRLESIRDRIIDPSLLPSLTLSTPDVHSNLKYNKPGNLLYRHENKPMRYTASTNDKESRTNNKYSKKPSSRNKVKLNPQFKSPKRKPLKISSSEFPSLKASEIRASASETSTVRYPTLNTPQLLANKKSVSSLLTEPISQYRDGKVPILSKYKPRNSKVTISFSTTMRPKLLSESKKDTIFTTKPKFGTTSNLLKNGSLSTPRRSYIKNRPISLRSKLSNSDSNGAASDIAVSRLKSPLSRNGVGLNKLPVSRNKNVLSNLRENTFTPASTMHKMQSGGNKPTSTYWKPDMMRSASEDREIIRYDNEPLTENTSYTCKMMCIRND